MKHKHLTLSDRFTIEKNLTNNLSFKAIGLSLHKDCTTISKEVRSHLIFLKNGLLIDPLTTVFIVWFAPIVLTLAPLVPILIRTSVVYVALALNTALIMKKSYAPPFINPLTFVMVALLKINVL